MKTTLVSRVLFLVIAVTLAGGLSSCEFGKKSPPPQQQAQPTVSANTLEALQAAAQKSPSFENYTSLGVAYLNAGKSHEALQTFKRTLEIAPSSAVAENNICATLNNLKQWDTAISHCKRAISLQPSNQLARNNLEAAERSKSADEPRISELKKNIANGKDVDNSRVDLGNIYYQRGDYEGALVPWREVPKGSPQYANALNDIGAAYIVLKRFDEARKALNEALRLQPNNYLAKNNLAWLGREESSQSH